MAQQRDVYSTISDAYLAMTNEVFANHNRFTGCLMLAALPAEWREKVLKEQHKTLPTEEPLDGIFSNRDTLKTPVLNTFDRAWSREERLETEKNALAKKSQKTESSAQVAASLFAATPGANTCMLAQQAPRPRSATPPAARQTRSGSGGRGRNEGKPVGAGVGANVGGTDHATLPAPLDCVKKCVHACVRASVRACAWIRQMGKING